MGDVKQLGDRGKGIDPKTMLLKVLEEVDTIEDICIVVRHKDDEKSAWCSTGNRWFWWACSHIMAETAIAGADE